MRLRSWMSIALCLLAFACKKESGKKGGDTVATPPSSENAGGTIPGTSGPIGDGINGQISDNPASCKPSNDCSQELPDPGPALGFKDSSYNVSKKFGAFHRGRDVYMRQGQDANLIAKFAYVPGVDKDVKGEDVDIYMSQGCDKGWKKVGSVVTSTEPAKGKEKVLDGVTDTGGYIMASLSSLGIKDLAPGRHRFVFFLRATNEYTDLYVEVLAKKSAIVLSDIDGTLTAFEEAAAGDFIGLPVSTHEGAPEMMRAFYERGYTIFYLTARPVFFMEKTRAWLKNKNFPPGIIHTTDKIQGAVGEAAAQFKVDEIAMLKEKVGLVPAYAFGNKPSDVKAFADAGIAKDHSWFYKIQGDTTGAQAHSDYRGLIPMAKASPSLCE